MPEEPDVSPEEMEVLNRVWQKRIEAKKHQHGREPEETNSLADHILAALKLRPDGMPWTEIRAMVDKKHNDEQIRQALLLLMSASLPKQKVEKKSVQTGERFLLAAS